VDLRGPTSKGREGKEEGGEKEEGEGKEGRERRGKVASCFGEWGWAPMLASSV